VASNPPLARCLLVDDEPAILGLSARMLTDAGFECRVASSGKEALETLEKEQIDVMLTDITMPKMDGLTLASLARAKYPGMAVVMLTGRADQGALDTALKAGAVEYLAKPFNAAQLVDAVKRVLELRR
jgi:DNA-binding NtrC family response regulator